MINYIRKRYALEFKIKCGISKKMTSKITLLALFDVMLELLNKT